MHLPEAFIQSYLHCTQGINCISSCFPWKCNPWPCYSEKQHHLKGSIHPKMKAVSSFTGPLIGSNLYAFVSSFEHRRRYFVERLKSKQLTVDRTSIVIFHTMDISGYQWLVWLTEEWNSYRFETIWGWVNNDNLFILGELITQSHI